MKKLFSVFLALVFLSSNLGFALGTHFCGSHAVESKIILGQADLDCGMGMMEMNDSQSKALAIKTGCCENVFQDLKINDDFKSGFKVHSPDVQFALLFAVTYNELFVTSDEVTISFIKYDPPPLERDIPVLVQSFRL